MKKILILFFLVASMSCSTMKQVEWENLPKSDKEEITMHIVITTLLVGSISIYLLSIQQ